MTVEEEVIRIQKKLNKISSNGSVSVNGIISKMSLLIFLPVISKLEIIVLMYDVC